MHEDTVSGTISRDQTRLQLAVSEPVFSARPPRQDPKRPRDQAVHVPIPPLYRQWPAPASQSCSINMQKNNNDQSNRDYGCLNTERDIETVLHSPRQLEVPAGQEMLAPVHAEELNACLPD